MLLGILKRGRPSVSFEVFPPKKDMPLDETKAVVSAIASLKPAFISVTHGAAGGSTGVNTCEIAKHVVACGVPALAHLTCVMATRSGIAVEARKLKTSGITDILALRGDRPPNVAESPEHFRHAVELVEYLRRNFPSIELGGACYPEGHPECPYYSEDLVHLREKVDAGLCFLTTQMFFDNNVLFHFLARLRDVGVNVPVVAGVMPVTNGRQIRRICELSGTHLPPRFKAIIDRFGDDPVAMLDAGVAYATEQIIDLFANGVNNVHVYAMNKPELARRIMSGLNGILGE